MEELGVWIIAILLGAALVLTILFFAVWIFLALFVRVMSIVLLYWVVSFLLAALIGIGTGVALPLRVLVGKGKAAFWQIKPDDLVEGRVIKRPPIGPNRGYGWDRAWLNYMPYQAQEDAKAVAREMSKHLGWLWGWLKARTPRAAMKVDGGRGKRVAGALSRGVPQVLWYSISFPAFVGYWLGAWVSTIVWFAVMGVIGLVVTGLQQLALAINRLSDIVLRKSQRATIKCPHCYGESSLPGYRCSNEDCEVVHWTMLPGPLGLFSRRCECGTQLPNTVSAASRLLVPVCPYCRHDLANGSGSRQTVQIAVIGSIGAGKSRLLDALAVEMPKVLSSIGGTFTPLNDRAAEYLAVATGRIQQRALTPKTDHRAPVGLPFIIEHGGASTEVQIMDVAGEAFTSWDETAKLRYLDTSDGVVLVLDPLALAGINDHYRSSRLFGSVLLASGDQEEAYASAVDRMRAESVPVGKRGLAVVLTKADILTSIPIGAPLEPVGSDWIRDWLVVNGSDLMVKRFAKDFREVRYFLVDSMGERDIGDMRNPWWVLEWLLTESKSPLLLVTHPPRLLSSQPPRTEESR